MCLWKKKLQLLVIILCFRWYFFLSNLQQHVFPTSRIVGLLRISNCMSDIPDEKILPSDFTSVVKTAGYSNPMYLYNTYIIVSVVVLVINSIQGWVRSIQGQPATALVLKPKALFALLILSCNSTLLRQIFYSTNQSTVITSPRCLLGVTSQIWGLFRPKDPSVWRLFVPLPNQTLACTRRSKINIWWTAGGQNRLYLTNWSGIQGWIWPWFSLFYYLF